MPFFKRAGRFCTFGQNLVFFYRLLMPVKLESSTQFLLEAFDDFFLKTSRIRFV